MELDHIESNSLKFQFHSMVTMAVHSLDLI
jgi:hypothetical protein